MDSIDLRLNKNKQYYDLFLENVKARSDSRDYSYLLKRFTALLPQSSYIIDIGCGTGEHLNYFKEQHLKAIGIEPSPKMREYCRLRFLDVYDGNFETLNTDLGMFSKPIGGIWCAASLLHVPIKELHNVLGYIHGYLIRSGVFFFTVRLGVGHKWDKFDGDSQNVERFIQLYTEKDLDNMLSEVGFETKLKMIEESYWRRKTDWISYICVKP